MAVYASVDDFIQQFSIDLIGTVEYPVSVEDQQKTSNQISRAIAAASAEVDLYISGLSLPSSIGAYLKYATCVIARKSTDLYTDREKVRKDYDDVIENLCKLAKGGFKIPVNRVYVGDRRVGTTHIDFGGGNLQYRRASNPVIPATPEVPIEISFFTTDENGFLIFEDSGILITG